MIIEIMALVYWFFILSLAGFVFFKPKKGILGCGLTGYSGKAVSNIDKLALLMHHNSILRGTDNTGFYTPEEGVKKDNIKAEEFLAKNYIPKSNLFIGHVRRSSVGGKLAECSHPFEKDNIVLVHNGTLTNYHALGRERDIPPLDWKVDSEVLAILLDKDSKTENKNFKTLSEYEGAAALLFTDKRDKDILYAFHDGERDLHYGMIGQSMYISSTIKSLELIQCTDILEFKKRVLYTIKFGKIISEELFAAKEKPKTTPSTYRHGSFYGDTDDDWEDFRAKNLEAVNKTTHSSIKNFSLKDNDECREQIRNSPKAEDYVDRWVQAKIDYDGTYTTGNLATSLKLTSGKWYFVNNSSDNNHDLKLSHDDKRAAVIATKFLFDHRTLPYGTHGKTTEKITKQSDRNCVLFEIGEIVDITYFEKSKNAVSVYHEGHNTSYTLPTSYIRPLSEDEKAKVEEAEALRLNEDLKDIPAIASTLPVLKIVKPDNIDDEEVVVDAETPIDHTCECSIIPELPEDEKLANFLITLFQDKFDDIEELAGVTSFDELKVRVSEFRELLNESYNFKVARELMAEQAEENNK